MISMAKEMAEKVPNFDDIPHDFYFTTGCENRYYGWMMDLNAMYPDEMHKTLFCTPTKECTTFKFEDGSSLVINDALSPPTVMEILE